MAKMSTKNCAQCGAVFTARTADVDRGWAEFCSKSCKARKQEEAKKIIQRLKSG